MNQFSNDVIAAGLALKIEHSDAGNDITVRQYLMALLTDLWIEEESFSGKRPFGNSGWQFEIYTPLVKAGMVPGKIDDGELVDLDASAADELVLAMIDYMGNGSNHDKTRY